MVHIKTISRDHPACADAVEALSSYRDALRSLSPEERAKYQGKVLAVSNETGEIIAAASDVAELRKEVAKSSFRGRPWSRVPGPCSDPLPLDALRMPQDSTSAEQGNVTG